MNLAYLKQNPDVATAILRQQVGADGPKWQGSVTDHYKYAQAAGEARFATEADAPPPDPVEAIQPAPFTAEQLQQIKDNTPISVSGGGGDYRTMNITQGPDIDYDRIQGFVGTPEVRDEEGNIVNKGNYHNLISKEKIKKMYETMVTINEADVVFNQAQR